MKKKMGANHGGRLAEMAAAWFRRAESLDVALQYEFTGVTLSPDRERVLELVDALVTRAIERSGGAADREDRWLTLAVDRQPDLVCLVCASAGVCPAELAPLAKLGAAAELRQYPEAYDLTVTWKAPKETEGDTPYERN